MRRATTHRYRSISIPPAVVATSRASSAERRRGLAASCSTKPSSTKPKPSTKPPHRIPVGERRRRGARVAAAAAATASPSDDISKGFTDETSRASFAFIGAVLLNVLLGTLYCWSCYLVPLEQALGVGRGVLSGVFSLATIAFTASVFKLGPALYSRLNPAVIASGSALIAGAGMLVASKALSYVSVVPLFVGYGAMFGAAAGVGYGLSVQISGAENGARSLLGEGLTTGLVTSARAGGAFVFAPIIRALLDAGGVQLALSGLGAALIASSAPLWLLLSLGGLDAPLADRKRDKNDGEKTPEELERDAQLKPAMFTLWSSLGLGSFAGLMVVAHASALLQCHGAAIGVATAGVSIVSLFTTFGRVLGGWACDRAWCGATKVLRVVPFVAVPLMAWGAGAESSVVAAQAALAAASVVYGVFASAVPVELRRRTGPRDFARQYGKVYTAWGVAGLAAPWTAGLLYDANGDYTAALVVAMALCFGSAVAAFLLKPGRSHEEWAAAIEAGKRAIGSGSGSGIGGGEVAGSGNVAGKS